MQSHTLIAPALLTILLAAAVTTPTGASEMTYAPVTQALSVQAGASVDFNQSVTSPASSYFTVSLMVVGTGATPIPASWVSVGPTSLNYWGIMTKTWLVMIAPPTGTLAGVYTAAVKAKPSDGNFGEGAGTAVSLTVDNPVPAKPTTWGRLKKLYR